MKRLILKDCIHYIDIDVDNIPIEKYINVSETKYILDKKHIKGTNIEGLKDIIVDRLIIPIDKVIEAQYKSY